MADRDCMLKGPDGDDADRIAEPQSAGASRAEGADLSDPHHRAADRLAPDRWDQLILRYLDSEAPDSVLAEVRDHLPEPGFRKLLAVHAIDAANLLESRGLLQSSAHGVQRRGPLERRLPPELTGYRQPALHSQPDVKFDAKHREANEPHGLLAKRAKPIRAVLAAMAAAVVVAAIVHQVVMGRTGSDPGLFLCTLEGISDGVYVAGSLVTEATPIAAGQNVATRGPLGTATLRFPDGTVIQLTGDSAARVYVSKGQKLVYVDRGYVGADVAPQPRDCPLMIHTPNATLEVVGTEFVFSVVPSKTELNVTEGKVLMKPKGGGDGVAVSRGEFAAVQGGDQIEQQLAKVLPTYRRSATPTYWHQSFDDGLPAGWKEGQLVPAEAEPAGGGAVAACLAEPVSVDAEMPSDGKTAYHIVQSLEDWSHGLVRLTEGSHLSYRVKMDKPQWYQVFIVVRGSPIADGNWSWNYEYQEAGQGDWSGVAPGEWREVSVPISSFKRNNSPCYDVANMPLFEDREGEPPPDDGLVVWVLFSTQESDRGLTIDNLTIGSPERASQATTGEPASNN